MAGDATSCAGRRQPAARGPPLSILQVVPLRPNRSIIEGGSRHGQVWFHHPGSEAGHFHRLRHPLARRRPEPLRRDPHPGPVRLLGARGGRSAADARLPARRALIRPARAGLAGPGPASRLSRTVRRPPDRVILSPLWTGPRPSSSTTAKPPAGPFWTPSAASAISPPIWILWGACSPNANAS